jgi:hypothetical protein
VLKFVVEMLWLEYEVEKAIISIEVVWAMFAEVST